MARLIVFALLSLTVTLALGAQLKSRTDKRAVGVNDPVTQAAVNVAVNVINNQVAQDGQTVTLKDVQSVNVAVSLSGLHLDIKFDVNVSEADGSSSTSACEVKVEATWLGQISNLEDVSCNGVLVNVGVNVG